MGNMIFIALFFFVTISGNYRYASPGVYPVGREMVIHSECGCEWRDVEPVEDIDHEVRQITPWDTGITFTRPGMLTGLEIQCVHSIFESPVDVVAVDWAVR